MGIIPTKLKTNNEIMNTDKLTNENETPILRIGAVSGCYSSSEYNMLRNNKGKQKAYVKGWEAAEKGLSTKECSYQPKIKDLVPTDPYFKAWHSGYESFLNNR